MHRLLLLAFMIALVCPPQVQAQRRHRAPPAKGHKKDKGKHKGHKKHRAPPAPEPDMPVRNPAELGEIRPDSGPPGTTVKIKGKYFDETVRVRFNGRWLRVIKRKPHMIRVRIPRNAATDRFVVSKAGFPDQTTDGEFTVIRNPVITGFAPRQGGVGTRIVITGLHFIPHDAFVIGGTEIDVVKRRHDRVVARVTRGVGRARVGVRRDGRVIAWSRYPFEMLTPPPVVTGFSPRRGDRGSVIRINGQSFDPTDWVELNGRRLGIRGRSPNHFEVVIGNHTTGRFMVRGRHGRRASAGQPFLVIRPPRIAGFSPRYGPPGTRLVVEGTGFIEGDQVYIGGAMLTVRTVNDRRIVAELPGGVGSGPVFVQRGPARFRARGRFDVIHAPVITHFEPRLAPPGARVEIRGRNFLAGASVLLAGRRLAVVGRKLPHELVVQIPPGARTGHLVVVTRGGSARSSIPFHVAHFAALSSMFPLHGFPGTRVTLRGHHFHKGMRVFLANIELPLHSTTPGSAVVEIPQNARTGRISLLSHGRRIGSNLRFTVKEPRPELEFSFAPITGRRGSEVTLTLTPPRPRVMVLYNGRPLPKKTLQGGRRIIVTIPGDARSGHFELELEGKRYRSRHRFRVR